MKAYQQLDGDFIVDLIHKSFNRVYARLSRKNRKL